VTAAVSTSIVRHAQNCLLLRCDAPEFTRGSLIDLVLHTTRQSVPWQMLTTTGGFAIPQQPADTRRNPEKL